MSARRCPQSLLFYDCTDSFRMGCSHASFIRSLYCGLTGLWGRWDRIFANKDTLLQKFIPQSYVMFQISHEFINREIWVIFVYCICLASHRYIYALPLNSSLVSFYIEVHFVKCLHTYRGQKHYNSVGTRSLTIKTLLCHRCVYATNEWLQRSLGSISHLLNCAQKGTAKRIRT